MRRLITTFVVFTIWAFAQNMPGDPNCQTRWETQVNGVPSGVVVPSVSTLLVTPINAQNYVRVGGVNFTNVSASTVTLTFTDNSTNCGGGPCNLLSSTGGTPLTLAAGTTYVVWLNQQAAVGGVKWSASAASAVQGWAVGLR